MENLVISLLRHEAIRTTVPKAKEARKVAERMITLGKKGSLHARRVAGRTVHDQEVLAKLFGDLASRFAQRPGGYTRIVQIGHRQGDAAPMAMLELVERVEAPKAEAAE